MFETVSSRRARYLIPKYEAELANHHAQLQEAWGLGARVLEFGAMIAVPPLDNTDSISDRFENIVNHEVEIKCRGQLEEIFSALELRVHETVLALEALKIRCV